MLKKTHPIIYSCAVDGDESGVRMSADKNLLHGRAARHSTPRPWTFRGRVVYDTDYCDNGCPGWPSCMMDRTRGGMAPYLTQHGAPFDDDEQMIRWLCGEDVDDAPQE